MRVLSYVQLLPLKGIGYSRDHVRRMAKAGQFPTPISLSTSRIAWDEAEIDAWLEQRAAMRSVRLGGAESNGPEVAVPGLEAGPSVVNVGPNNLVARRFADSLMACTDARRHVSDGDEAEVRTLASAPVDDE